MMTIQRLRISLSFVLGQRTACRSVTSLMLLVLIVMGLPALSGAQQSCQPNGDVDQNGNVTAADALLAFQQALSLTQLSACQQRIANVFPQPAAPDGSITASDALCIFQKALGLPSCLDVLPPSNQPPVADAGINQYVDENALVKLAGSGNDVDGTIVRYHWIQTSGTSVQLFGADTPNPSFTAPEIVFEDALVEDLVFQLTVTDDDGASASATVVIAVFDSFISNEPPTANAGLDQRVDENTLVTLLGSGTDSDGTIASYEWIQIGGTPVQLFGADTPNPSFTAPEVDSDEELVFELGVFDDAFGFAADTVTVTVLSTVVNTPPVASAGPDRAVDENEVVTLSGSGTDSDGTITSYSWTQTSGTTVSLSGRTNPTATFTAPAVSVDETLTFRLTVTDDDGATASDEVSVTVRQANQPPTVNAGSDQVVDAGMMVVLAGTASDPDGTIVSYLWEQTGGTTVSLAGTAAATAMFTTPDVSMDETLTFRLTVTDDDGATASDEVSVTVRQANQPPAVNAGMDRSVDAGMMVVLTGTANDPDGTIVSYLWEQTGGTMVSLAGATAATAMFTAPDVSIDETLTFRLTVTDDDDATASGVVSVTVQPRPAGLSLSGTVTNYSTGAAISGAMIQVTQYVSGAAQELDTAVTDNSGFYEIELVSVSGRTTVKAEAAGFAPQSVIVNLMEDMGSATADLAMVPVDVVQNFMSADGAEVRNEDHTLVSVPANSLVTASGSAHAGSVTAMATVLDASSDPSVMPGDFMSLAADTGAPEPIESFGAMNVTFMADDGESLNLGAGQEASVSIPLASMKDPMTAPATMPLFYWSDERGHWIEEGTATLEEVSPGKWAYVGSVSHFTTWNADVPYEVMRIRGCVEDGAGNRVAFAKVTATGRDYVGRTGGRTDANGWFDIPARRNSEVLLTARQGVNSDSLALSTGNASITLNSCLTLMPRQCASYVPGIMAKGISVNETTHLAPGALLPGPVGVRVSRSTITGPEGLTASGLDVDNAVIKGSSASGLDVDNAVFHWRWAVAPIPEPDAPDTLDPNNGIFIAATEVEITGPDGLTALGYAVRVANPPHTAGLDQGWNYRTTSDGVKDGRQIYVSGESISVEYWDSGVKVSDANYRNGKPHGNFNSYDDGEEEGIQYRFYSDERSFDFEHRCAGTLHGRTGEYRDGRPYGDFDSYVNGERVGVQHDIYRADDRDEWDFLSYQEDGALHGPTGRYEDGEPHGFFFNFVDGQRSGRQHAIYRADDRDEWNFVTASAGDYVSNFSVSLTSGTLHGPTGQYEDGEPHGFFFNFVDGQRSGLQHAIYRADDRDEWNFVTASAGDYVSNFSVSLTSGTLHGPTGRYEDGEPHGFFFNFVDGQRSGLQHAIYRADDRDEWRYVTASAGDYVSNFSVSLTSGTLHGPTGRYEDGEPHGFFFNFVDGQRSGLQHAIYRADDRDEWRYVTASAGDYVSNFSVSLTSGTLHGPTGQFRNGLRHGYFGSYANGEKTGTWTRYRAGEVTDTTQY